MPEGRLTVNGVRWYVKDHLGSVRAVVDGSTGGLLAVTDYEAYGEDTANATASSYLSPAPAGETFRDHFTGKEDQVLTSARLTRTLAQGSTVPPSAAGWSPTP